MANRTLPKHIRCASHTLNLIVTADVQKALKDRALFELPASPKHANCGIFFDDHRTRQAKMSATKWESVFACHALHVGTFYMTPLQTSLSLQPIAFALDTLQGEKKLV